MNFRAKILWAPKIQEPDEHCADAAAAHPGGNIAAISDGVGEALRSRHWANLLVRQFVTVPPSELNAPTFLEWLAPYRRTFTEEMMAWVATKPWNQQNKVYEEGSQATFMALTLDNGTEAGEGRWEALAVGDCCLFQWRDNALVASWPFDSVASFGLSPGIVATQPRHGPTPDRILTSSGECREGDLFILATDAMSYWLLMNQAAFRPDDLLHQTQEEWRNWLDGVRSSGSIRNDDTTLMLLSMTQGDAPEAGEILLEPVIPPEPAPPAEPAPSGGDSTDPSAGTIASEDSTDQNSSSLAQTHEDASSDSLGSGSLSGGENLQGAGSIDTFATPSGEGADQLFFRGTSDATVVPADLQDLGGAPPDNRVSPLGAGSGTIDASSHMRQEPEGGASPTPFPYGAGAAEVGESGADTLQLPVGDEITDVPLDRLVQLDARVHQLEVQFQAMNDTVIVLENCIKELGQKQEELQKEIEELIPPPERKKPGLMDRFKHKKRYE